MDHDAWFFVGVFAFIFLIWVATGGPTHPLSFTGPRLALPGPLGGGTYLSLPQAPFTVTGGSSSVPGSSATGGSSGSTPTPIKGVSFGTPSTYRGKVSLSHYVSGAGASNPNNEYVQISLSTNAASPITISGWTLKSESTGGATVIPVGVEVPRSGIISGGLPITLQPGERAIIVSGRSPIGSSFRENKCIGYFATFQTFSPSLPLTCPLPKTELETYYGPDYIRDDSCVSYVNSLARCKVVITPPAGASGACANFLTNHLNYNGCITTHEKDTDFKGKTWRVYLGRTSALWRSKNEVVKLLDAEGKTVDAFSY